MRSNILLFSCLFIALLCAQVLSNTQLDQRFHGVQGAVYSNRDGNDRENVVNGEPVYSLKRQKGSGGGGTLNHKPSRSGARERLIFTGPSIYISSAAICVSLCMLRVFVF